MENLTVNISGVPLSRMIIGLSTKGCEHARKTGGCSMCGFMKFANEKADDKQILEQFDLQLSQPGIDNFQVIDILHGGSFLNDNEISEPVRRTILQKIAGMKNVEHIFIESRPEYISVEKLKECRQWAGNKTVEVGIGLESTDDYIRNAILRKNFTQEDFIRAVSNIKQANCDLFVYLLIKPPVFSEKEAIEDAVSSTLYLFDLAEKYGVNIRVGLEPLFICHDTELENLFNKKEYELINLWSVAEIIGRVYSHGTIYVGLDDEGLSSNRVPYTCDKCYKKLVHEIREFNKTQSFSDIKRLDCECKTKVIHAN